MTSLVAFKYRKVNEFLIDSLRNNYIYFSNPEQLNDPFDCRVDIQAALQAALKVSDGEKAEILTAIASAKPLFDQIQADMTHFGVFSLAKSPTNSVMWSHYGNEHRGICLAYSIPDDFINDPSNKLLGRAPVSYGDEPITEWLLENAETVDFEDPRDFAIKLLKKVLTVKASDWKYEFEYRLIRTESGQLEIPAEYLTQVCCGLLTNKKDVARVKDALQYSKSGASIAHITRSKLNFGLEIKPGVNPDAPEPDKIGCIEWLQEKWRSRKGRPTYH